MKSIACIIAAAGCFWRAAGLHDKAHETMAKSALDLEQSPKKKFFATDPRVVAERPANQALADAAVDLDSQALSMLGIGVLAIVGAFWPVIRQFILTSKQPDVEQALATPCGNEAVPENPATRGERP